MNFDNYKFRAHSIGNIMGGIPKPLTENQQQAYDAYSERKSGVGRPLTENQLVTWADLHKKATAKPELSDTAKKFLAGLVWEELTKRRNTLRAKYLDKGIQAEERSITLYSLVTNQFFQKNKERRENEYFSGEADNVAGKIRDIKSSWSFETYPLIEESVTNSDYLWQLDVYMDLWQLTEAELIYCLVDTPYKLINDELRRLDWQHDIMDYSGDIKPECRDLVVELVGQHLYTEKALEEFCTQSTNVHLSWFEGKFVEIPEEIRVKVFDHSYCANRNKMLKDMVVLARKYMNSLIEQMGENVLKFQQMETV